MHNTITHHLLTNVQLIPKQWLLPPSQLSQFIWWAWHRMLWNNSLVSGGQLPLLCPLLASCAPAAYSLVGWCEKQKRSWLYVSTAQQQLKHQWIIHIILIRNPKHSTIPATGKKI